MIYDNRITITIIKFQILKVTSTFVKKSFNRENIIKKYFQISIDKFTFNESNLLKCDQMRYLLRHRPFFHLEKILDMSLSTINYFIKFKRTI